VKVCFVKPAKRPDSKLIEPLECGIAIAKLITKNPGRCRGGQHPVCFEVDDINEAVDEMGKRGATVLGQAPYRAHGYDLIIFRAPEEFQRCPVIETMETPQGSPLWGLLASGVCRLCFSAGGTAFFLLSSSRCARPCSRSEITANGTEEGAPPIRMMLKKAVVGNKFGGPSLRYCSPGVPPSFD